MDELPPALAARLRPPTPPARSVAPRDFDRLSHARLRGFVQAVLDSPEGTRNTRLHWAACRAGELVATGEITEQQAYDALLLAAVQVGIPEREAGTDPTRGAIGNGLRRGQQR